MTFNLQSGFNSACGTNAHAQADFIQGVAPDYLGAQEVVQGVISRCNCNIPQIIANAAGMASRFTMALPYGNDNGYYGTAVASSQTILDTKAQQLAFPVIEQRVVTAIRTQPLALKGRNLWYVNTHVDYFSKEGRMSQINQVLSFINSIADSQAVIVLGGDFNGGPDDDGYKTIKNAGFTNAWETFNGSPNGGYTYPAGSPGSRFDNLWFKAPSGVTIRVTSVVVPDTRVSDHRPLVATLDFTVGAPVVTSTSAPSSSQGKPTTSPSGSNVICVGPITENTPVTIKCPLPSQIMKSTMYANYGFTSGSCGNFQKGTCVGGSSTAVVNAKCIGRNSCTFTVSNLVFGDPCPHNGKSFYTQVLCE